MKKSGEINKIPFLLLNKALNESVFLISTDENIDSLEGGYHIKKKKTFVVVKF